MKEIKLTQGQVALVDDEDYDRVMAAGSWCVRKRKYTNYAVRAFKINNKYTAILLHTFILRKPEKGIEIDHKDGNGLNNQKNNLRFTTHSQNQMNKRKRENCSSKYKGVYWYKSIKKWNASIDINKKHIFLGHFDDEKQAAEAYNFKAIELFSEYANLNVID